MRDFLKDVVLPFTEIIIIIIFLCIVFGGPFGIKAMFSYKECKVWGGQYNIYTGCLMEHNDKTLTLDDYKRIQVREITQPIEHNIKIKGAKNE